MRHWNNVNQTVRIRPEQDSAFYMPFIFEPDGSSPKSVIDTRFGENWATSFLMGAQLRLEQWGEATDGQ